MLGARRGLICRKKRVAGDRACTRVTPETSMVGRGRRFESVKGSAHDVRCAAGWNQSRLADADLQLEAGAVTASSSIAGRALGAVCFNG